MALRAHPDEDGLHAAAVRGVLGQRGHELVAGELGGEVVGLVQDEILPPPGAVELDTATDARPACRLRPHVELAALQRRKDVRAALVAEYGRRDRPPRPARRDRDPFQRCARRRGYGSGQPRVALRGRRGGRGRPAGRKVCRGGGVGRRQIRHQRIDLRRAQRVLPARHAGRVAVLDDAARVVGVARDAIAVQPARVRHVAAAEDREMADRALLLEDAGARRPLVRRRRGASPGRLRVEAGLGDGEKGREQQDVAHAQCYTPCRHEWEPEIAGPPVAGGNSAPAAYRRSEGSRRNESFAACGRQRANPPVRVARAAAHGTQRFSPPGGAMRCTWWQP